MKERLSRIFFVLYLAAVGVLCLGNFGSVGLPSGTLFGIPADKIVHFLMFMPFPVLLYYSCGSRSTGFFQSVGLALGLFVLGVVLGGLMELLQGLTNYRTADLADLKADALGLIPGALYVLVADTVKRK